MGVVYVLFREHIRLRVRVQVSLLALLDKPTMAWLVSAMSSQERLECGSTFRKRNMYIVQSQNLVTHFLLVWRKPKKTSLVNIKILYIYGDVLTA